MRRWLYALLLSLSATTLAGCGNKGPLTLPPARLAANAPTPAPAAATSAQPAADAAQH